MKKLTIASLLASSLMVGNVVASSPFEDIDPSHWAYPKIKFLYDHGVIRGTGTGRFDGNERISRYEAAALVYQSMQTVQRTQAAGGSIDADIMDTINSLMTELTDEMQVMEVRIEENSDSIAMLRNHLASMHGKPTQGMSIPVGQGRLKFMGQAMISAVMGGDNSFYNSSIANNGVPVAGTDSPTAGNMEFVADYLALAIAADVDERTSLFARANVYTGGSANGLAFPSLNPGADGVLGTADDVISLGADGVLGGGDDVTGRPMPGMDSGLHFNDYLYIHVRDLWSDWDLTLGRMGLPWGHEVAGAFRTNPYFVSNSLVDQLYGNRQITGAYFSTESDDGNWNWGLGVHNGDQSNPMGGRGHYSHLYPAAAIGPWTLPGGIDTGVPQGFRFSNYPVLGGLNNGNFVNDNEDDALGFLLHVGARSADGDFRWDLNYFTNGGDNPGNVAAGFGAMSYINLGGDYRINQHWAATAEYVQGSVEIANPGNRGLAGALVEDDFTTWYLQLVYNMDYKSSLAFRMSQHTYDATGPGGPVGPTTPADDEISELALSYSRKVSDNGTLIVEYSAPDWEKIAGQTKAVACANLGSACNDSFDTVRASYRVDF